MNTLQFRPEILVAGFAHMVWLFLLSILLLGVSPHIIISQFYNVGPGLALILISIVFIISFFLGTVFEQLFIVLSHYVMLWKKLKPESILDETNFRKNNKAISKELARAWDAKSFFRSMFIAGMLISIFILLFDIKLKGGEHWLAIFLISVFLDIITCQSWVFIQDKIREQNNQWSPPNQSLKLTEPAVDDLAARQKNF
jgi:hypothetical protein